MKRIIALVLVIAMVCAIALTITSCGVKATCLGCGKEFTANEKDVDKIGDSYVGACPDCQKALEDALGGLGDLLG